MVEAVAVTIARENEFWTGLVLKPRQKLREPRERHWSGIPGITIYMYGGIKWAPAT